MIKCRLVTFDIVNTVLRVIGSPALQYTDVARQHGLFVDPEKIASVYHPLYIQMKADYPQYGIHHEMNTKQWWNIFVLRVFAATGCPTDLKILSKVTNSLWERFSEGANWEVLPHTAAVLEQLKNCGFLLAAVSNFDERLEITLQKQNLLSYFDSCVTVISSQAQKPDPRIFWAALNQVSVKPAEAAHVGDDIKNDYIPAKSIGMHAFLFAREAKLQNDAIEHRISEEDLLTDIRQVLDRVTLLV